MNRLALLGGLGLALALGGCNCGESISAESEDGGTKVVDGATSSNPDGSLPAELDASQSASDAAVVEIDGAVVETDGSTTTQADASTATQPDGSTATQPDGSTATQPDGSTVTQPDGSTVTQPDGSTVTQPDGSTATQLDAGHANHAPVVSVPPAYVVAVGAQASMQATASDPDGDPITYAWLQTSGSPTVTLTGGGTANATFTAPTVAQDTDLIFTVTVCDPQPLCASASTKVTINVPPAISQVTATPNPVTSGSTATLNVVATDPGDTLTYAWSQSSGPAVTLSNGNTATATFTAPLVAVDTVASFAVQVCDSYAACTNGNASLTIHNTDHPPVAVATANPSPASAKQVVTLDGSGSTDPDTGDTLSYSWSQTAGPAVTLSSGSAASPTFTAPVVQVDTTLTFSLKVCDQIGACDTVSVSVTILGVSTYVSEALGSDATGQGTQAKPWRTIGKALTTAQTYGFTTVYVDKGNYPENPTMLNGVAVQCGYDSGNAWSRTPPTVSTITASAATGVHFPAGANGTLDGCTVKLVTGGVSLAAMACITVQDASPQIINCIADATATGTPPMNSSGLAMTGGGAGGTVTVTGGSFTGGNGSTQAAGISVGTGMTLALSGSTAQGALTAGTASSYGIYATGGTVGVTSATLNGGTASALAAGLWAKGAAIQVSVASSTVKGGTIPGTPSPGTQPATYGVFVSGVASVSVTHSSVDGGSGGSYSRGINCATVTGAGAASFTSNTPVGPAVGGISGGASTLESDGVRVENCSATISGNTIVGGTSSAITAGVDVAGGSVPIIQNNPLIQGGSGTSAYGVLVVVGTPTITGNTTIQGSASASGLIGPTHAWGISIPASGSGNATGATITDNTLIEGGQSTQGSIGIGLASTRSVNILRNATIRGGTSPASDWGIADGDPVAGTGGNSLNLVIDRNLIAGTPLDPTATAAVATAGGLYLGADNGSFTNNVIIGGLGDTAYGVKGSTLGGLWNNYVTPGGVLATNKTIAYGLYLSSNGPGGTFNNNIIDTGRTAFTRYGFYENAFFTPVAFYNNDFYPDAGGTLYYTSTPTALNTAAAIDGRDGNASGGAYNGTLSVNPLFVSEAGFNFHLQKTSQCIDKGYATGAPSDDMDGDTRPMGAGIDVGPDEAQ